MYTFDSRVRYSETASDGRLGICSAVHYMQDCSIFQSEALGVGVGELKKHNRAWLISSWQVEFLRRPEPVSYTHLHEVYHFCIEIHV